MSSTLLHTPCTIVVKHQHDHHYIYIYTYEYRRLMYALVPVASVGPCIRYVSPETGLIVMESSKNEMRAAI